MHRKASKKAFTLIETLVGVAVFLVVATAMYRAYSTLFVLTSLNQYKILALNLANEEFEIARNLSYADVGEVGGIPNGKIPHVQNLTRGGVPFIVTMTVRNVDLPFDGTIGGTPNDLSPADNKLVEVEVDCLTCANYTPVVLTTTVAPKNLETASTNGALFIKVFDANGVPVSGANVHVVNVQATPHIVIDDVTDVNGMLQIVDVPPGVQAYSITVSKPGYSSAQTYPPGGTVNGMVNTSPTEPDATVILQQLTQVSFAIDKLSSLSFSSVTPTCTVVPNVAFSLTGSKMIGTDIPKYSRNLSTNAAGTYSNSAFEWDSYIVHGVDATDDIIGINPLNPLPLNPDTTQNVMLITAPKNPKTVLVTVKDSATGLAVTGATVTLSKSGYSSTQVTDRGYINQTDWVGGSGQDSYSDFTKYIFDDGGIDASAVSGEIRLREAFGNYVSNGSLESSTIDTGLVSNFYNLVWSPGDQPTASGDNSVRFQLATNKEITATTTWNYIGPDGTSASYYTVSDSVINPIHNGDRYARYKLFLSTDTATSTPSISDVALTFTSACIPPGQVAFTGLSSGTYDITVSKSGYSTETVTVDVSSDFTEQQISIGP